MTRACANIRRGVGKTTLMRAISGIYRADFGTIHFANEPIGNLAPHRIVARGLAQAPEGRQIFSNTSVRENLVLGFGANPRSQFEATLHDVLQHLPILAQRVTQQAGSLSGGEQQMLCIGRALMRRPRSLLLDEPSLSGPAAQLREDPRVRDAYLGARVTSCRRRECGLAVRRQRRVRPERVEGVAGKACF